MRQVVVDWNVNDTPDDIRRFSAALGDIYASEPPMAWRLDLAACRYIGPDASAMIYALWIRDRQRGLRCEVILPVGPEPLRAFCEFVGLKHYLHRGPRPDPDHPRCETVPLSNFYQSPYIVSGPVVRLVERHLPMTGEFQDYLQTCITEVVQNIIDHAESPVGGVLAARFISSRGEVRVAVVDHGLGIPKRTRLALGLGGSDRDILQSVMQGGMSSRSQAHNQGLGLKNLVDIVQNHQGSLLMLSGDAVASSSEGREIRYFEAERRFPGTVVCFSLKTEPHE